MIETVGLPYVDRPCLGPHRELPDRKKALVVMAVIVAVLADGIWGIAAWNGEHITACGVDEYGPYAKVRVNSLWGGLGASDREGVSVDFTYDGAWYWVAGSTVKAPGLGSTRTVVRGIYPPTVIELDWDGGPKGKITVEGHKAYHRPRSDTLVTQKFAARHPTQVKAFHRGMAGRTAGGPEMVPDDLQKIGCSIGPNAGE